MQESLDRVYQYKLKRQSLTWVASFVGALALLFAYFVATNNSGIRFLRSGSTLDPGAATVFLWGMFALLVAVTAFLIGLVALSYQLQQRIAFTPQAIIVPKAFWSNQEQQIAYNEIQQLSIRTQQNQRWLVIKHFGGKSQIAGAMLANGEVFEEIVNLLAVYVSNANNASPP